MSSSNTQEIAKIGSIFGAYFLIQAYGYSIGIRGIELGEEPAIKAGEAIVFGFQHVSHFLRPWDKVAWPLSPVVGLPLLLYSLYLPALLRQAKESGRIKTLRIYLAAFFTVILFPFCSGLLGADLAARLTYCLIEQHVGQGILSLVYFIAWLFWLFIAFKFLFPSQRIKRWLNKMSEPWPDILAGCATGLILFAVYLGSEFDGAMDRLTNADEEGICVFEKSEHDSLKTLTPTNSAP